jgi:hypothetical protein
MGKRGTKKKNKSMILYDINQLTDKEVNQLYKDLKTLEINKKKSNDVWGDITGSKYYK